jgi:hypothetical protein
MGKVRTTTEPVVDQAGVLERLYRAEYTGMVRLAYTLVGSNAEAEDLVQDSFVDDERAGSARHGRVDRSGASVAVIAGSWTRPPSASPVSGAASTESSTSGASSSTSTCRDAATSPEARYLRGASWGVIGGQLGMTRQGAR